MAHPAPSLPPEVLEEGGMIPGILGVPCGSNLLKILFCCSPAPRLLFGAGCSIGIRLGAAFSNQYSSSSDEDEDESVDESAVPEAALPYSESMNTRLKLHQPKMG